MKHRKTVTSAAGHSAHRAARHSASSGSGEAFWRRATGRTAVGLVAVAALALVGPGQTFAAPASENGPGAVESLGGLGALANQVASANAELASLNSQLAGQRESVNKTIVDLQRARAAATRADRAVAAAQKALKWADDKIVAAQQTFDSQAALAYTQGSAGGGIASYLSASNPNQLLQRGQALALVSEAQQMTVDSLKRAHDEQAKRVEAAKKKQDDAAAAQAVAEQRKADAVAAIASVQRAAAAAAAKAAELAHHRDEAQAALAGTTVAAAPAAPAPAAPATAAASAPALPTPVTAAAAPAVTPAAADTTTTTPALGGSDWVSLLMELVNTASSSLGSVSAGSSATGSAGTGSSGGQSAPPAVNEVAPTNPAVAATPAAAAAPAAVAPIATVTSTPAAATAATATAATAPVTTVTAPTTAAAAAAATADTSTGTTDNSEYYEGDGTDSTGDLGLSQAPTITGSAGVETVVNRAMSQLGVTYAWGGGDANGPTLGIRDGGVADSYGDYQKMGFDCSGLMVYAFAGVGISLPHYSGYQYTAGKQVPIAQAQRGDMIFWGPGGSEHVALYLGNGKMIEAMESGTVIHITDVRYSGIQPYAVRLVE